MQRFERRANARGHVLFARSVEMRTHRRLQQDELGAVSSKPDAPSALEDDDVVGSANNSTATRLLMKAGAALCFVCASALVLQLALMLDLNADITRHHEAVPPDFPPQMPVASPMGSLDMDADADGFTDDGRAAKSDQPKRSVWRPQWKPPNGHQLLPQDSSPPPSRPPARPPVVPPSPTPAPPPPHPMLPPTLPPSMPVLPPAMPAPPYHRCRMHCSDHVPMPIISAAALPESQAVDRKFGEWTSGSGNCVDGSRMTFCLLEGREAAAQGQQAWLSAHVQLPLDSPERGGGVHSVAITIYKPWDSGDFFAPFEVWLGDSMGDQKHRCNTSHVEPSHTGAPAFVGCRHITTGVLAIAQHRFVTVVQIGPPRRWQVSELEVFAPAPPAMHRPLAQHSDADSDVPETVAPGEVLRRIAWRFERGVPSDILGEAGVLVHVHDGNEDVARPWLLCETSLDCSPGSVDAWSASVISRKVPWLYEETKNGGGFIIHPSVEILCAYPSDVGTLGSAQRPGACSGLLSHGFVWSTLGAALRPQYDGSWRRQWQGMAQYNEVLVGASYWREHMPWALEAFLCTFPCHASSTVRQQHAAFLAYYQLTRDEVPLLQYRCGSQDSSWDSGRGGSTREAGACFEEVVW